MWTVIVLRMSLF